MKNQNVTSNTILFFLGIDEVRTCIAYLPEDGLYVYASIALNTTQADWLFGENFNIQSFSLVIKTKSKYFYIEMGSTVKLWNEKEFGVTLYVTEFKI